MRVATIVLDTIAIASCRVTTGFHMGPMRDAATIPAAPPLNHAVGAHTAPRNTRGHIPPSTARAHTMPPSNKPPHALMTAAQRRPLTTPLEAHR